MSEDDDVCSKGYMVVNGRCVPRMNQFRPAMYRSIFGVDPPPDPTPPPTPPPTPCLLYTSPSPRD